MYKNLDDANVTIQNDFIRVYNGGGFFAYFAVSYFQNGQRVDVVSPVISVLQTATVYLPPDATNIAFGVFMAYDVSCWSEIYSDSINTASKHCYYLSGPLWAPKTEEVPCGQVPEPVLELKNLSQSPGKCKPPFLGGNVSVQPMPTPIDPSCGCHHPHPHPLPPVPPLPPSPPCPPRKKCCCKRKCCCRRHRW